VPYLHRHWRPALVSQGFSASASERPVQTPGDATALATRHAVTIETTIETTAAPVNPVQSAAGNEGGFWFLGQWIPL
jgi:hypothetical protein